MRIIILNRSLNLFVVTEILNLKLNLNQKRILSINIDVLFNDFYSL